MKTKGEECQKDTYEVSLSQTDYKGFKWSAYSGTHTPTVEKNGKFQNDS